MLHTLVLLAMLAVLSVAPGAAQPSGTMTWGGRVTLATRWLDTSETESEITPFMILYALHRQAINEAETLGYSRPTGSIVPRHQEFSLAIQRLLQERVVFAPIWENGFIRALGPSVEEAGLTLIPAFPYSGPLEDVRLKR